ncbi:golgin candidate 1-like isoform X1 [Hibiscus syriacus]|uniref:golgin candidate 1-like isoform X1 n=1 Tax=Hibiscus syriacus TaxID=106335 RepID=UPI0019249297|nr:golgin candidate 1-like isoform X1 [Hibiscus syriacus]XP_039018110.1 golgin candidate 1-like isoform X1 [Hibiscus syriacus]
MASWLKVAEDLFEVVDRRAKLVASELSEEQSDSQSQASNVLGSSAEKTKPRTKEKKRLSTKKSPEPSDTGRKETKSEVLQSDVTPDKEKETFSSDNEGSSGANSMVQANPELHGNSEKDTPKVPSPKPLDTDLLKNGVNQEEVYAIARNAEGSLSTSNGELLNENAPDVHVEHPPSSFSAKDIEVVSEDHLTDGGQDTESQTAYVPSKTEQEKLQHVVADSHVNSEAKLEEDDVKIETPVNQKKPQEKNSGTPSKMVQDQLDEAQGLLKTTNSTGQSKEARLARVCAGLSSRLQEYKSENAQLEELLIAERELSKSYEARIKQLQQDLSVSKSEVTRIESNMVEALAAKNSEIEALVNSMDALKKQAALYEGNLASLQANMESIMRNRELTETRMMQALREELSSAERRAEEERAAHNATKMAAMERQVELEHRAVEASTALARIQRVADERTAKSSQLEQKLALLEVECASLNQELQDMEARARRGQKKAPEEANQMLQIQAWQEEVEHARQGQRDAESKLSSLEAEVQKMRVEMAAMKRDAEHYSRQEHMELEKRYRELTDLLYYKQTQLEAMASEKAAAEFQLEKEIKRLQEAQVEVERSRLPRHASSSWEEDTEIKALEPLPVYHRHAAAASIQLQKAVKLLDSGAVRATRFLWRYPTARIILLCYLVFVHLFLMYLLHRLQEQADILAAHELAKSMGLTDSNLP